MVGFYAVGRVGSLLFDSRVCVSSGAHGVLATL